MDEAEGWAVFPNVGKGGLIVGGAHGTGLVYEKTNLIGKVTMTQGSIGAQIGGQTFAEIICFETAKALDDFKASKMEMSAEVSAVAAAEGVGRAAKYTQGVAVFTMPKKGLMAQASIGGQKFKYEPMAAGGTGPSQGTEKGKQ
jgi:lipid-binding SYLF domain-containing protein